MWYANMASDMTIPLIFNGTSNGRIECNCNKIKSTRFFFAINSKFYVQELFSQYYVCPNLHKTQHSK